MKVTFKSLSIALIALAFAFTSCSSETPGTPPVVGAPTDFGLKMELPTTKATVAGQGDELKVNDMTIYIFNDAGLLEKTETLSTADYTISGNQVTVTNKITSTSGAKKFAIGVNLSTLTLPAITKIADLHTAMNANLSALTSSTGVAAMFSDQLISKTLVSKTDSSYPNVVTASVERMVAKVSVEQGANFATMLDNEAGTYSNVQFAIRQSNTRLFPMKTFNGSSAVIDPNWDSYNASDFENFSDYIALNATGTSATPANLKSKYCAENTSKLYLEKESTYASIKTVFIPKRFSSASGVQTAYMGAATTYWVVKHNDGTVLFFQNETTANNYMTTQIATDKGAVKVAQPYTNGVTYFNAFVNKTNKAQVVRNNFYNLVITKLSYPGNPTPDPKDPDKEVTTTTDIDFSVNILPWEFSSEDHDL